jgi:hypothetical protein
MPVSASNRIQGTSGSGTTVNNGDTFTVTLPSQTTAGSTLMVWLTTSNLGNIPSPPQGFDPPWFADVVHASQYYIWRRDNEPGGETSWVFTPSFVGSTVHWAWWIEEWSAWSTVGQPDAAAVIKNTAAPTNPATSNAASPDVSDFAALALIRASPTGSASTWPAGHSWPGGWNEVAWLTIGTGAAASDSLLGIAEAYPGVSGSMSVSMTWDTSGGGAIPSNCDMWFACYQPGVPDPGPPVILAAA